MTSTETVTESNQQAAQSQELSRMLQLFQLADSALPVGGLAHSFGLESMTEEGAVRVRELFSYLSDLLSEGLLVEAVYCRSAHAFCHSPVRLNNLNTRLSALRPARESREASLALGRRFLQLARNLDQAVSQADSAPGDPHFSVAFGYVCGVLGFEADASVAAFLHQHVLTSLSTAQRLLPLGQLAASQIAWDLKPAITAAVTRSATLDIYAAGSFSHRPEVASMRHPFLTTRLFIS